jgi:SAM-dependent methyltransferase
MNVLLHYTNEGRDIVKQYATGKILDIGAMVNPMFANVDTVDINQPCTFQGNINNPDVWSKVLAHVKKNGKYDFAICTHTLEDISNPLFVCEQMAKVAKGGGIVVPSKYIESGRHAGYYRGFIHHRWIWNIEGNNFVGYPKLNLFEHSKFDKLNEFGSTKTEIVLIWEGSVDVSAVNGDFLGPDNASVERYYENLIADAPDTNI